MYIILAGQKFCILKPEENSRNEKKIDFKIYDDFLIEAYNFS